MPSLISGGPRMLAGLTASLLVLVVSACGATDRDTAVDPAPPEVRLLAAGDGGQKLRLRLEEGQEEVIEMRMTQAIEADGSSLPSFPIVMTMRQRVVEATDDTYTIEFSYDSIVVEDGDNPEIAAAVRSQVASLEQLTGETTIDHRGQVLDYTLEPPDDLPAVLDSVLEQVGAQTAQLATPLPAEPVGPGARWRVRTDLEIDGVRSRQINTFELVSLDGTDYTLDTTVKQEFLPGESAGFEVTGGGGTVTGSLTGDLTALAPLSSTGSGTATLNGLAQGREQSIVTKTQIEISRP